MKFSKLVALLLAIPFLNSCHQCYRDYICDPDVIIIGATGFTTQELDSLYIEKYFQDGNFTRKLDSFSVVNQGHLITDSNSYYADHFSFRYIVDGYDYILKVPRANKEYKFYKMVNQGKSQSREDYSCGQQPVENGCVNGITSYYLDGTKVTNNGALLTK